MDIDARAFGQLEGEVKALREMTRAQSEVLENQNIVLKEVKDQLAVMQGTLSEARGGWKMILLLGGGIATLGGALGWLIQHMTWR